MNPIGLSYIVTAAHAQALYEEISRVAKRFSLDQDVVDRAHDLYVIEMTNLYLLNDASDFNEIYRKLPEIANEQAKKRNRSILQAELKADFSNGKEYVEYYFREFSDDIPWLRSFIKDNYPSLLVRLQTLLVFT